MYLAGMIAVIAIAAAPETPEPEQEARIFTALHESIENIEVVLEVVNDNRSDVCGYLRGQPIGTIGVDAYIKIQTSCDLMRAYTIVGRSALTVASRNIESLATGGTDPEIRQARPDVQAKIRREFARCALKQLTAVNTAMTDVFHEHHTLLGLFHAYRGDDRDATRVTERLDERAVRMERAVDVFVNRTDRLLDLAKHPEAEASPRPPPHISPCTKASGCRDI